MRRGSLGIGLVLCALGAVLAFAPSSTTAMGWFSRWWPVAPLVIGAGSLLGFATKRRPSSPFRGAALLVFGALALAVTMTSSLNPLELYGRFWPVLLAVVALVSILRAYTYQPGSGEAKPALFGAGKLALVGVIVVSGLAAHRVVEADPNLLARISMPAGLSGVRDELFGEQFAFPEVVRSVALPSAGVVAVTNRYGDVIVEATDGSTVEVSVVPTVRAYNRETAQTIASRLELTVSSAGPVVTVATNRDAIDHEIRTDIHLRVPRAANLRVSQAHGRIQVVGLAPASGILSIDASHAPTTLTDVVATLDVKNVGDSVSVTRGSGSLSIAGRNDVTVENFAGDVRLEDSDSVRLKDLQSRSVDLVSVDHASVSIDGVKAAGSDRSKVTIQGEHTEVSIKSITGDVSVQTSNEDISAEDISGALNISASHSQVSVRNVGSLKVKTDHDGVNVDNVSGLLDIENDHGSVSVFEFGATCSIRTSFEKVRLQPKSGQVGDVHVDNQHGEIEATLPADQGYRVDAKAVAGDARVDHALSASDTSGPNVVLRTTHGDIRVGVAVGQRTPA